MLKASDTQSDADMALRRLTSLEQLTTTDIELIETAACNARCFRAGTEIIREGDNCGMHLLLSGWAAQTRIFSDGRRQVVGFLVPGDQFEYPLEDDHRAATSTLALCNSASCPAPTAPVGSRLEIAYKLGEARMRMHYIDHIARLGRLSAAERMCDLLLELFDRLTSVELVVDGGFEMPVTQELFSDALGLTPVHTNRTLQLCRQRGDIIWGSGRVCFPDPSALAQRLGRKLRSAGRPVLQHGGRPEMPHLANG